MTETAPIPGQLVRSAVEHHLPGRTVVDVQDRGVWIRHSFRITLDGGEVVYLKADRAFPASEKEAYICHLLQTHGLPAPRILALNGSGGLLPTPFVIQEHVGGERLGELLTRQSRRERLGIYGALGRFYRNLHSIHHSHSGWIQGAGNVLPFSPNEHQFNEVIVRVGSEAVARGLLAADLHLRLRRLWSGNLAWLEPHRPSLVVGALHWTVYLAADEGWHVTKVMDLSDALYWDPAWDLAGIKYPVFREPPAPELWAAFVAQYGPPPKEKRLQLYRLMQHLDAAMGNYMEVPAPEHERWKASIWANFERMLEQTEALCHLEEEDA